VRHIKNKDLLFRRIDNVEEGEDLVVVSLKDGQKCAHLVEPSLSTLDSLSVMNEYSCCSVTCYNTIQNFEFLIKNWDALVRFKRNFSISFVNPFSRSEKRWAIFPTTHDMVTERPALRRGLKILYDTVEETSEQELLKLLEKEK